MSSRPKLYFFGARGGVGHYWWDGDKRNLSAPEGCPWERIDGTLTNQTDKRQGSWALHVADGWTALAFHDYTVDSRPGSNSVIVSDRDHGDDALNAMAAACELVYPDVGARLWPTDDGDASRD